MNENKRVASEIAEAVQTAYETGLRKEQKYLRKQKNNQLLDGLVKQLADWGQANQHRNEIAYIEQVRLNALAIGELIKIGSASQE